MIHFSQNTGSDISVILEKKTVGVIKQSKEGFQYFPLKSKNGGEVFKKLVDCKKSLM